MRLDDCDGDRGVEAYKDGKDGESGKHRDSGSGKHRDDESTVGVDIGVARTTDDAGSGSGSSSWLKGWERKSAVWECPV